jgi:hypothetical protein
MKMKSFGRMGQLDKIGDNLSIFDRISSPRGLPDAGAAHPNGRSRAAKLPGSPPSSLFDGHLPSEAATAAVVAHPSFPEAARTVAAGLVALYQGERVVNLVMPDRIRYIISVFAIHLHFAGRPNDPNSGLTASRLCKLCVERKICSEGRAESMLGIMREFGHLMPAPTEEDKRLRRLVPAESLFAWHRKRCTHFFQAAAKVMPDYADALAALDTPAFTPSFLRHLARSHVAGFHYVEYAPDVRQFYERSAGGPILMSIALSGASDDSFPPSRPVSLSLTGIARDFEVSRAHVRRVVQEGVSSGLLERAGPGGDELAISQRLSDAIRRVLAAYMIHYTHCARLACADIARESAVA